MSRSLPLSGLAMLNIWGLLLGCTVPAQVEPAPLSGATVALSFPSDYAFAQYLRRDRFALPVYSHVPAGFDPWTSGGPPLGPPAPFAVTQTMFSKSGRVAFSSTGHSACFLTGLEFNRVERTIVVAVTESDRPPTFSADDSWAIVAIQDQLGLVNLESGIVHAMETLRPFRDTQVDTHLTELGAFSQDAEFAVALGRKRKLAHVVKLSGPIPEIVATTEITDSPIDWACWSADDVLLSLSSGTVLSWRWRTDSSLRLSGTAPQRVRPETRRASRVQIERVPAQTSGLIGSARVVVDGAVWRELPDEPTSWAVSPDDRLLLLGFHTGEVALSPVMVTDDRSAPMTVAIGSDAGICWSRCPGKSGAISVSASVPLHADSRAPLVRLSVTNTTAVCLENVVVKLPWSAVFVGRLAPHESRVRHSAVASPDVLALRERGDQLEIAARSGDSELTISTFRVDNE
jgi:hypothetical protein